MTHGRPGSFRPATFLTMIKFNVGPNLKFWSFGKNSIPWVSYERKSIGYAEIHANQNVLQVLGWENTLFPSVLETALERFHGPETRAKASKPGWQTC